MKKNTFAIIFQFALLGLCDKTYKLLMLSGRKEIKI